MDLELQLLPPGVELNRLQASMLVHRAGPDYLMEKRWRIPFKATCKLGQITGWESEENRHLNLVEEARWSLEAATILFITNLLSYRLSGEGEELGAEDVANALSQFPIIRAGMPTLGATDMLVPSLLFPTVPLDQVRTQKLLGSATSGSKSGPWAGGSDSPGAADQQVIPPEDSTNTSTSRDTSTVSLSDEEYEGLEEKEDPLLGVKMEVVEHEQLQTMFGQPEVVHLPNPFYIDSSSSEGEMEQEVTLAEGGPKEEQGQVVTMVKEGIIVVDLSSDESEGGE